MYKFVIVTKLCDLESSSTSSGRGHCITLLYLLKLLSHT